MINIDLRYVKNESNATKNLLLNMSRAYDDVSYVKRNVSSRVQSRRSISGRLNSVKSDIRELEEDIEKLAAFLKYSAYHYEECEKSILRNMQHIEGIAYRNGIIDSVIGSSLSALGIRSSLQDRLVNEAQNFVSRWFSPDDMMANIGRAVVGYGISSALGSVAGFGGGGGGGGAFGDSDKNGYSLEWEMDRITSKVKDKELGPTDKDFFKKIDKEKRKIKSFAEDENGNPIDPDSVVMPKEKMTWFEAGVEAKAQYDRLYIKEEYNSEYVHGEKSMTLGTAEAHSSFKAGLYGYDEDGNKFIAPAIKAEVGASASAFTASAKGRLGDDVVGLNGSVNIAVAKAEAKADAVAMILDDQGHFDPSLYGSASVEVIAAEVKGKVGVDVLGVEGSITGSVNYGVGFHAKAGLKDGVLKVDIGASFGLGASAGFEVDVSGAIDAVADFSESLFKGWHW